MTSETYKELTSFGASCSDCVLQLEVVPKVSLSTLAGSIPESCSVSNALFVPLQPFSFTSKDKKKSIESRQVRFYLRYGLATAILNPVSDADFEHNAELARKLSDCMTISPIANPVSSPLLVTDSGLALQISAEFMPQEPYTLNFNCRVPVYDALGRSFTKSSLSFTPRAVNNVIARFPQPGDDSSAYLHVVDDRDADYDGLDYAFEVEDFASNADFLQCSNDSTDIQVGFLAHATAGQTAARYGVGVLDNSDIVKRTVRLLVGQINQDLENKMFEDLSKPNDTDGGRSSLVWNFESTNNRSLPKTASQSLASIIKQKSGSVVLLARTRKAPNEKFSSYDSNGKRAQVFSMDDIRASIVTSINSKLAMVTATVSIVSASEFAPLSNLIVQAICPDDVSAQIAASATTDSEGVVTLDISQQFARKYCMIGVSRDTGLGGVTLLNKAFYIAQIRQTFDSTTADSNNTNGRVFAQVLTDRLLYRAGDKIAVQGVLYADRSFCNAGKQEFESVACSPAKLLSNSDDLRMVVSMKFSSSHRADAPCEMSVMEIDSKDYSFSTTLNVPVNAEYGDVRVSMDMISKRNIDAVIKTWTCADVANEGLWQYRPSGFDFVADWNRGSQQLTIQDPRPPSVSFDNLAVEPKVWMPEFALSSEVSKRLAQVMGRQSDFVVPLKVSGHAATSTGIALTRQDITVTLSVSFPQILTATPRAAVAAYGMTLPDDKIAIWTAGSQLLSQIQTQTNDKGDFSLEISLKSQDGAEKIIKSLEGSTMNIDVEVFGLNGEVVKERVSVQLATIARRLELSVTNEPKIPGLPVAANTKFAEDDEAVGLVSYYLVRKPAHYQAAVERVSPASSAMYGRGISRPVPNVDACPEWIPKLETGEIDITSEFVEESFAGNTGDDVQFKNWRRTGEYAVVGQTLVNPQVWLKSENPEEVTIFSTSCSTIGRDDWEVNPISSWQQALPGLVVKIVSSSNPVHLEVKDPFVELLNYANADESRHDEIFMRRVLVVWASGESHVEEVNMMESASNGVFNLFLQTPCAVGVPCSAYLEVSAPFSPAPLSKAFGENVRAAPWLHPHGPLSARTNIYLTYEPSVEETSTSSESKSLAESRLMEVNTFADNLRIEAPVIVKASTGVAVADVSSGANDQVTVLHPQDQVSVSIPVAGGVKGGSARVFLTVVDRSLLQLRPLNVANKDLRTGLTDMGHPQTIYASSPHNMYISDSFTLDEGLVGARGLKRFICLLGNRVRLDPWFAAEYNLSTDLQKTKSAFFISRFSWGTDDIPVAAYGNNMYYKSTPMMTARGGMTLESAMASDAVALGESPEAAPSSGSSVSVRGAGEMLVFSRSQVITLNEEGKGEAQFSFNMPDQEGSFVVRAVVVTGFAPEPENMFIGTAVTSALIRSAPPVYLRAQTARFLRALDVSKSGVIVVANPSELPADGSCKTFRVHFTWDNKTLEVSEGSSEVTKEVCLSRAEYSKSALITMKALTYKGTAKFTATLLSDAGSASSVLDAVSSEISLLPPQSEVSVGTSSLVSKSVVESLKLPEAIPDSANMLVGASVGFTSVIYEKLQRVFAGIRSLKIGEKEDAILAALPDSAKLDMDKLFVFLATSNKLAMNNSSNELYKNLETLVTKFIVEEATDASDSNLKLGLCGRRCEDVKFDRYGGQSAPRMDLGLNAFALYAYHTIMGRPATLTNASAIWASHVGDYLVARKAEYEQYKAKYPDSVMTLRSFIGIRNLVLLHLSGASGVFGRDANLDKELSVDKLMSVDRANLKLEDEDSIALWLDILKFVKVGNSSYDSIKSDARLSNILKKSASRVRLLGSQGYIAVAGSSTTAASNLVHDLVLKLWTAVPTQELEKTYSVPAEYVVRIASASLLGYGYDTRVRAATELAGGLARDWCMALNTVFGVEKKIFNIPSGASLTLNVALPESAVASSNTVSLSDKHAGYANVLNAKFTDSNKSSVLERKFPVQQTNADIRIDPVVTGSKDSISSIVSMSASLIPSTVLKEKTVNGLDVSLVAIQGQCSSGSTGTGTAGTEFESSKPVCLKAQILSVDDDFASVNRYNNNNVLVTFNLPAGLEIDNETSSVQPVTENLSTMWWRMPTCVKTNVQVHKVEFECQFGSAGVLEVNLQARANVAGSYTLPPTSANRLSDMSVRGYSAGLPITVV